ncbi:MAG: HPr family phosphocarrier protein [Desulfatibacillaceae bacterium]
MNGDNPETELEKNLTISNELGLHARCAAQIAELAQKADGGVNIRHKGQMVDAASMLDILTLAAGKGEEITVIIKDATDEHVLREIARLVESGFGE